VQGARITRVLPLGHQGDCDPRRLRYNLASPLARQPRPGGVQGQSAALYLPVRLVAKTITRVQVPRVAQAVDLYVDVLQRVTLRDHDNLVLREASALHGLPLHVRLVFVQPVVDNSFITVAFADVVRDRRHARAELAAADVAACPRREQALRRAMSVPARFRYRWQRVPALVKLLEAVLHSRQASTFVGRCVRRARTAGPDLARSGQARPEGHTPTHANCAGSWSWRATSTRSRCTFRPLSAFHSPSCVPPRRV
jgi:hypothetical protein